MIKLVKTSKPYGVFTGLACATLLLPVSLQAADGFAAVNGDTTGGVGGTVVTVTNKAGIQAALNSSTAQIVQVQGMVNMGSVVVIQNKANKTLVGLGANSGLIGGFQFKNCTNFIIKNLTISFPGGSDAITIQDGTHHFWVDHCTFGDAADGQLDITHGADYVTVSWCKFNYTTAQTSHRFSSLVGHDDANGAEDTGKLRITYHHNWWSTKCTERMPRVRFGQVHVYNNYFSASGNSYCVRAGVGSQVRIQNNQFENVKNPWEYYNSVSPNGKINAAGNTFVNTTGTHSGGTDSIFTPPYSYTMDTAATAKTRVTSASTGAGPH